nr:MAG TPA: hypothetical protein [Caudoviricetes sp.]
MAFIVLLSVDVSTIILTSELSIMKPTIASL